MKKCKECQGEFKPKFSSVEMFCSRLCSIKYSNKKKAEKTKKGQIPKRPAARSKKRAKQERSYSVDRKEFLSRPENKFCFIPGCGKHATTIEHRKGRVGYADDWARENNIPLLLDKRFWAACCWDHNLQLENDPKLSAKHQLSKIHNGKKGIHNN